MSLIPFLNFSLILLCIIGTVEDYISLLDTGKWLCLLCNKSFSRKQDVKRHIMNLHQGNQEVICPLCNKKCKNPHTLSVHNSIYHRNRNTDNPFY